jgi:hypothetical protein
MILKAELYSTPRPSSDAFQWRWRALEGTEKAAAAFDSYYDCWADAQRHGFTVLASPVELALPHSFHGACGTVPARARNGPGGGANER